MMTWALIAVNAADSAAGSKGGHLPRTKMSRCDAADTGFDADAPRGVGDVEWPHVSIDGG